MSKKRFMTALFGLCDDITFGYIARVSLASVFEVKCHRRRVAVRKSEEPSLETEICMIVSKPRRTGTLIALSLACTTLVAAAEPHGAHVHGKAQAAVVVNGAEVAISLTSAMFNITGFERAPQTSQEEEVLAVAVALLEDGAGLFAFDDEAGCALNSVSHSLPAQTDQAHESVAYGDDHNPYRDLEADFEFTCEAPQRLRSVRFDLFERFENLESLDVVAFVSDRQVAGELSGEKPTLAFSGQ